jgi:hypothetical protein
VAGVGRLSPAAQAVAREAGGDLRQSLAEIPDASLSADWRYLCRQMAADAAVPSERALADLRQVMALILRADNVRAFLIAGAADEAKVKSRLDALATKLDQTPSRRQDYGGAARIAERIRERVPAEGEPQFIGLVNENTRSGVFINTSSCASYTDFNQETLLRFLAARLYGGGGAHSMFMKTWGAGLAYSNGLRSDEASGRIIYYAERCPDLSQTLSFVVNELETAPEDTSLAQYALAQAFSSYRGASSYEDRGEAMAANLADRITPERVRDFRSAILDLRSLPGLYRQLRSRMESTYAAVVPGYGTRAANLSSKDETISFVIGPEKQLESYEAYLHREVGKEIALYRIYPRDYWLVDRNRDPY